MVRRGKVAIKLAEKPSVSATRASLSDSYESRPLGQALDFLRMLWGINHRLATTSRYMQSKFGVTGRQRLIVRVVKEFPGLPAGALARVLHLDPSTLTGVLHQMSERGFLQLQADVRDRRRLLIQLTPKGRRMCQLPVGDVEAAVARTLSRVSLVKLEATREVLSLLVDNLDRRDELETAAGPILSA